MQKYNFKPITIQIPERKFQLEQKSSIITIGSCFSEYFALELDRLKINHFSNPFGVTFHPLAILRYLKRAMLDQFYSENDFFKYDNYYFNFEHSGTCAKQGLNEYIHWSNDQLIQIKEKLKNADVLVLTFGSAFGYSLNGVVVGNCHKQPQSKFEKRLSTVDQLTKEWETFYEILRHLNPKLKIILSVSPVIHLKDGLVENTRSKSVLNLFCHLLSDKHLESIHYFPSFEIIQTQLRDYHYYEEDGLHPNSKARSIVFEYFWSFFASENLKSFIKDWNSFELKMNHRSMLPFSNSNISFLNDLSTEIEQFEKKYEVDLFIEKEMLKSRLEKLA